MAHLSFDPIRYWGLVDPRRSAPAQPRPQGGKDRLFLAEIGDLAFEIRPLSALLGMIEAWQALESMSIEANVFHGPAFLATAQQHLVEASGQMAALVWDRRSLAQPRLLGLWPLRRSGGPGHAGWHKGLDLRLAASGTPLLDRDFAVEAASALLAGLRQATPGMAGVIFGQIALDGPTARAFRSAAALGGLDILERNVRHRPCIWNRDAAARPAGSLDAGHPVARALSRHGDVRLVTATSPDDVRDATELFLALEASQSAACGQHPLLSGTREAAFFRSLTRTLSRDGQVSVHMLEAGNRLVAASVMLSANGHGWLWRVASDAALQATLAAEIPPADGALSALLDLAVVERLAASQVLALLDAGDRPRNGPASAGHAWNGHQRIGDLALGVGDDGRAGATRVALRRALSAVAGWSRRPRRRAHA
jgi:hypothetical protein